MNIKVTVGIPVYNAGQYVKGCVLSVLNQTLKEIELLVIDDHGTDDSIALIRSIAVAHQQGSILRVVDHGVNRGVAHARNTIIDEAKGKYIFFMDQDDSIVPDCLELMYSRAEQMQAETVWGSNDAIVTETGEHLVDKERHYEDKELIGPDQMILYECRDLHENMQHTVWNILFLTDFLRKNSLRFEQHGHFDDTILHARMQPIIERAILLSKITYTWNIHAGSGSNFQYREHIDVKEAFDAIEGSRIIIDHCKTLIDKNYFDIKCAKVMKQAFFTCCGILKHRHQMNGVVENRLLHDWLQHPATFIQICSFKRYKYVNLFFWTLGKMPSDLMVFIISRIGKKKGFV
jgi:glycosyltransferase involved in cell wall biosynthesis